MLRMFSAKMLIIINRFSLINLAVNQYRLIMFAHGAIFPKWQSLKRSRKKKPLSHNKIDGCRAASKCFITVNTAGEIWIGGSWVYALVGEKRPCNKSTLISWTQGYTGGHVGSPWAGANKEGMQRKRNWRLKCVCRFVCVGGGVMRKARLIGVFVGDHQLWY